MGKGKRRSEILREELEREIELKEVELKKLGFKTERIDLFLDSNFARNIIEEEYEKLKKVIIETKLKAPEEYAKLIEELAVDYTEHEREFEEDVKRNFKNTLLSQLIQMTKLIKLKFLSKEVGEETFRDILMTEGSKEAAGRDLRNISKELSKMLLEDFMEKVIDILASEFVISVFLNVLDSLQNKEDLED